MLSGRLNDVSLSRSDLTGMQRSNRELVGPSWRLLRLRSSLSASDVADSKYKYLVTNKLMDLPDFDVLVIGSGHAGIEAALASARLGSRTLMLTQNLDTIGQMSCNPAIGGSAKSHIVKEVDALGGTMAINADATGIQFRVLNQSKGEAVWATRVQCDKKAYQFRLKAILEKTYNLQLLQGTAATLLIGNRRALGVTTDLGVEILAKSVVITAGTFLRGLLHV